MKYRETALHLFSPVLPWLTALHLLTFGPTALHPHAQKNNSWWENGRNGCALKMPFSYFIKTCQQVPICRFPSFWGWRERWGIPRSLSL